MIRNLEIGTTMLYRGFGWDFYNVLSLFQNLALNWCSCKCLQVGMSKKMSYWENFEMFATHLRAVLRELDWPFEYIRVCRCVFRTLSNIYGRTFSRKLIMAESRYVYSQKRCIICFRGAKYVCGILFQMIRNISILIRALLRKRSNS